MISLACIFIYVNVPNIFNKKKNIIIIFLQESCKIVQLWVIGFITFMALEAVAMVYSNVLRDHVNRVSINKNKKENEKSKSIL